MLQWAAWEVRGCSSPGRNPRDARLYLLVPVIFFLVPAILEFGSLLGATLSLNRLASEAVEVAMVGGSPCRVQEAVNVPCKHLSTRMISVISFHRAAQSPDADAGAWHFLGEAGVENNAGAGDLIMIELQYQHRLLFGSISAPFFGAGNDNTVRLTARAEGLRR
jgi:hypothetical protein